MVLVAQGRIRDGLRRLLGRNVKMQFWVSFVLVHADWGSLGTVRRWMDSEQYHDRASGICRNRGTQDDSIEPDRQDTQTSYKLRHSTKWVFLDKGCIYGSMEGEWGDLGDPEIWGSNLTIERQKRKVSKVLGLCQDLELRYYWRLIGKLKGFYGFDKAGNWRNTGFSDIIKSTVRELVFAHLIGYLSLSFLITRAYSHFVSAIMESQAGHLGSGARSNNNPPVKNHSSQF